MCHGMDQMVPVTSLMVSCIAGLGGWSVHDPPLQWSCNFPLSPLGQDRVYLVVGGSLLKWVLSTLLSPAQLQIQPCLGPELCMCKGYKCLHRWRGDSKCASSHHSASGSHPPGYIATDGVCHNVTQHFAYKEGTALDNFHRNWHELIGTDFCRNWYWWTSCYQCPCSRSCHLVRYYWPQVRG